MSNASATATATTCPAWCQNNHQAEPADYHVAVSRSPPASR